MKSLLGNVVFTVWVLALSACAADVGDDIDAEAVGSVEQAVLSGNITLVAGSPTAGGYDFSAGVYTGLTPGDFYFTQGAFWANNNGQRGVVSAGTCASVAAVTTLPTSGYTRFGVSAVVGRCYVALTHSDERDNIVFRVDALTSTSVNLTWKLVPSGSAGATLIAGDSFAGGYDFSTRTYTGLTPGDFYFTQGGFWANNTGQRGVQRIGPCSSLGSITQPAPETGYTRFGVNAAIGTCYAALTHNEEHDTILFRVDDLTSTTVSLSWKLVDYCYGYANPRQSVNCWLTKNPAIASYVVWQDRVSLGHASATAWSGWKNVKRDELRDDVRAYTMLLANAGAADPDPLADPPVNQEVLQDTAFPVVVLSSNDAWRLYVKTIAMSLAVELNQYVPWSVTGASYDAKSLASLFDSRHLVSYTWSGAPGNLGVNTPKAEGYIAIANVYDAATHATFAPGAGFVTPAPPAKTLAFLRSKALVGTTRAQTILNTLDWARRMRHAVGNQNALNSQQVWQYRGPAPVSRMIDTTINAASDPSARHYTPGCEGTSGFLDSVLRTVNIPVDSNMVAGSRLVHSVPRFMTEGLYLSHGDDPYMGADIYGVPASAWLISETTYAAWFVNQPGTSIDENFGRGNVEAELKYLSGALQRLYCSDPVPGANHAHSLITTNDIFALRPHTYPLSYLENLPPDPTNPSLPPSLWARLALKIGPAGCAAAIRNLDQQLAACTAVTPASEQLYCAW